jgi:DNA polymerase III delta' subunit
MSDPASLVGRGSFATFGHRAALEAVARAVRTERPPHALLIVGRRGMGKTTLALDLAAGCLCLMDDPASRPCRACAACRRVIAGTHPDVHLVGPEGAGDQIRLGQVQRLATELALTAMEGRARIAIVASAQRLNPDAQNALLKTLEEPGPATCLILCADDDAPLLPTLVSRTARLRLAPVPIESLTDWLAEAGHADPGTARSAAILADGRPGMALALMRQPESIVAWRTMSRTLLELLDADRRTRLSASAELVSAALLIDAASRGEPAPGGSSMRLQPIERRRALATIIDVWRQAGRDLAVAGHGDGRGVRDRELLGELRSAADGVDMEELRGFLDQLDRLGVAVEAYASPELVLDALLIAWPRARARGRSAA